MLMSKLPLYIDIERNERAVNGYQNPDVNLENKFYGRIVENGLPLNEIPELKNLAYDMSNFAYTCAVNDVPQWQKRNFEKSSHEIRSIDDLEEIGWQIARTHITRFRPGTSNIYDKINKNLYISSDDIIRINDDFNIDSPESEFNAHKILRSMARTLVQKGLGLTERPF